MGGYRKPLMMIVAYIIGGIGFVFGGFMIVAGIGIYGEGNRIAAEQTMWSGMQLALGALIALALASLLSVLHDIRAELQLARAGRAPPKSEPTALEY